MQKEKRNNIRLYHGMKLIPWYNLQLRIKGENKMDIQCKTNDTCTGILEYVLISILTMETEPVKRQKINNLDIKLKVRLNKKIVNTLHIKIDCIYHMPIDTTIIMEFVKEYINMNLINISNIKVTEKSKFDFVIDLFI